MSNKIKSNFIFVDIIVNNNPFKPRTIKLLLFILNVDFYFVVNALFINEDFISEVYNSNDELVDTLTTDKEGKAISKLLVKGEYHLKEIDSGYKFHPK